MFPLSHEAYYQINDLDIIDGRRKEVVIRRRMNETETAQMQCPTEDNESIDVLPDYVAGRLEPSELAVLERHLTTCSRCAEFTLEHGQVWQALDAWEAPAVNQDFNQRLFGGIERETAVPSYQRLSGFRTRLKAASATTAV